MQLEHSFTVPVPVEVAWAALLDPERVAPCFPGATLTSVDGPEFSGTVKVRMGPVALTYKGTGRFASSDEAAKRVVLVASGKDSRGNGTASATVTATVAEASAGSSKVDVVTDLTITGRPAQLGRGLIGEVGGKIIDAFAECLASQLSGSDDDATADDGAAAAAVADGAAAADDSAVTAAADVPERPTHLHETADTPERPRPAAAADEIDLVDFAGRSVLKRAAPVVAGVLAVVLVLRWLRRR
jgi:carbon monoxide dehydrogenase subunit G